MLFALALLLGVLGLSAWNHRHGLAELAHSIRTVLGVDAVRAIRLARSVLVAESVASVALAASLAAVLAGADSAVATPALVVAELLLLGLAAYSAIGWVRAHGAACGCGVGELPNGPLVVLRLVGLIVAAGASALFWPSAPGMPSAVESRVAALAWGLLAGALWVIGVQVLAIARLRRQGGVSAS